MKNIKKLLNIIISIQVILLLIACSENPIVDDETPCPPLLIDPTPPYSSPVWHPSGKFIGFNHTPLDSITYPFGENCIGTQHFNYDSTGFWLIDIDGKNKRRILKYQLQTPTWSPKGDWIAFVLDAQIYKMPFNIAEEKFDTTRLERLTFEGRNFFPSWSPDGVRIAFDSNNENPTGGYRIWIMNINGADKLLLSDGRMPSWDNNTKWVYYIGLHSEIYKTNLDNTSEIIKLTNLNEINIYATDNRFPRLSPNEHTIAFASQNNVWLMDTSKANLKQATTNNVDVDFGIPFSWSPNSNKIVYTQYDYSKWTYDNGVLYIIDTKTGIEQQLTFNRKK